MIETIILVVSIIMFVAGVYSIELYTRYGVYRAQFYAGYALVACGVGLFLGLALVSNL